MDQEQAILEKVKEIQKGKSDGFTYLAEVYKPLMLSLTGRSYGDGSGFGEMGFDDLYQEASMALYDAALSFDTGQSDVTFGLYSKICIKNRLISLRRRCMSRINKQKRAERTQKAVRRADSQTPQSERRAVDAAEVARRADKVLSKLEKRVFALYAAEMSYKEIAAKLQISEKSVDNAIYRIKCKLKKFI